MALEPGQDTPDVSDYLVALSLQLNEAGAGDVSVSSLSNLDCDNEAALNVLLDKSLAHSEFNKDVEVAVGALTALDMAAEEEGLSPRSEVNGQDCASISGEAFKPATCEICLESFQFISTFKTGVCDDFFCYPCIIEYVSRIAQESQHYPIVCPCCREEIDNERCLHVLAGTGTAYRALETFIIKNKYYDRLRYCANPECAVPFDWIHEEKRDKTREEEAKISCPDCKTDTCANCRTAWHENQTCKEYAEHEKDTAFLALAGDNKWTRCPSCGHMVELHAGDCNYVVCICRCGFCHKCGVEYETRESTANNIHGKPGCTCALFEDEDANREYDDSDDSSVSSSEEDSEDDEVRRDVEIPFVCAPHDAGNANRDEIEEDDLEEEDTESSEADTEPSEADTESSKADTESSKADTESSKADTEPSEADTEPSEADTEPSEADTEPSEADTESSKADTESSEQYNNYKDTDEETVERPRGGAGQETNVTIRGGVKGPNGYINLMAWLQGIDGRQLPKTILASVSGNTCPYKQCSAAFGDIRALEQHLIHVQRHKVFLCCGRPFYLANAYDKHRCLRDGVHLV